MPENGGGKLARAERWVMWAGTVVLVPLFLWGLSMQRTSDLLRIENDQRKEDGKAQQKVIDSLSSRLSDQEKKTEGVAVINTKIDNLTTSVTNLTDRLEFIFRRELDKRP